MRACPMPMEEAATTVPTCTRPLRRTTQMVGVTTPVAVTTRRRAGITHRRPAITSQRRAITTSRGCINRRRVITSHRNEAITGPIRVAVGTVMAGAVGMDGIVAIGTMIIAAADAITADEVTTTVAAITLAEAATDNMS